MIFTLLDTEVEKGEAFYGKSNTCSVQVYLVLLAEEPELATTFGLVEIGVRGW